MLQTLKYYWRTQLALFCGVTVAATIFTGALLVGDAMRGSLRDMVEQRLGDIDDVMVSNRFFRHSLGGELMHDPAISSQVKAVAGGIILSAAARTSGSNSRAGDVTVVGIDAHFLDMFSTAGDTLSAVIRRQLLEQPPDRTPAVVINDALAAELGVARGDRIRLLLQRQSSIHRESLFGEKSSDKVLKSLRVRIADILSNEGIGRFGLRSQQHLPQNVFIRLDALQEALEQPGLVNALFSATDGEENSAVNILNKGLQRHLALGDMGLSLRGDADIAVLESSEFIINDVTAQGIRSALKKHDIAAQPILTYLANELRHGDQRLPYSTVTALDIQQAAQFAGLRLINGNQAPALAGDDILLNEWAARDLGAQPGDSLEMTYYLSQPGGALATASQRFRLTGILSMNGLGKSRKLTPVFPGIEDALRIADWDPPFPVDLNTVRPKDEAYWNEFRGTPKAFIALDTGQRLWQNRFGSVTAFMISPKILSDADAEERMGRVIAESLSPAEAGLIFQPLKAQGLRSAAGATDFSGLFIGFSLFLIVAAALLVGLLFRLNVEQRVREVGMKFALGFTPRAVLTSFFGEAALIAIAGGAAGLLGALLYAHLMIYALRTLWVDAVGTRFLSLHIAPQSLVMGFTATLLIVAAVVGFTLRRLRKMPPTRLIAGDVALPSEYAGKPARVRMLSLLALAAAILMVVAAAVGARETQAGLFFGSGAFFLTAGILWTHQMLIRAGEISLTHGARLNARNIALKNNARKRGRSLLSISLVACASFLLVAVGANRKDFLQDTVRKDSGVGGYVLMAESELPLLQPLNTPAGRFDLGFSSRESARLSKAEIMSFRLLPGEDASCLNLYKPEKPRILGVPPQQIQRSGFLFNNSISDVENPWTLLNTPMPPGVIPAIGDANSVQWILHAGLGKDLEIQDPSGKPLRLRFVALLQSSIFQSEVLIAEEAFIRHFPAQSGQSYFLVDAPDTAAAALSLILENTLEDYGFDATGTLKRLADFQAVENTYLSVFQILGGLGLLLGIVGLSVVMFRNINERRSELAMLQAMGYRPSRIQNILSSENFQLIIIGLIIGAFSALIAVAPQILNRFDQIPWISLCITLGIILLSGLITGRLAARLALRSSLIPALRHE